ncbi:MAG: assimilatory sulfite reductase (NADPH) flavoprotein subunit [Verrucomicrobiales bacterium]|nr:assimilatory sulfite reductase (NADPH) flavoprotein subunit [Verrucomicrobiales bacterium]
MQIPDNAPFSPEQRTAFNQILASMTPEQHVWVSGFFCGVTSSTIPGAAPVAAPVAATELTILFGTESGNCEELADKSKKIATKAGFKTKVVNMSETDSKKLSKVKNLLVIVSTWGDGDPPDAATEFYAEIMGDGAAKFSDTNFSVCALGDTSYEQFCETGKRIDVRLEELGAKRVFERQDCDLDYEEPWQAWLEGALKAFPVEKPAAPAPAAAGFATLAPGGAAYSKKNPFPAEISEKIVLNGTGSAKETLHLELNLEGSGLQYEVGDALAVIPENRDVDVQRVLKASGLSANTQFDGKTLADALKKDFDITSLTSRIAGKYNAIVNNVKLSELLAPENKKKFADWAWGRQFVDLLEEFPCKNMTVENLTGMLRKMAPRLYSIASSPKAHEGEVHLTVAAVRYDTHGKDRVGVASTYVADLVGSGDKVPVYVHSNKNFRLPADPSTDVIMIGPGTGIAPFRAFVEERHATEAPGRNWLFFGDQHYTYDFLYQLEWQEFLKEGALDRLDVAFSRDQPEKVYVQDKLRQSAAEVYEWIKGGAHIYVCGDASRMAHDVHTALIEIIAEHGGKSTEEAEAFVAEMKKAKRYQRDVY